MGSFIRDITKLLSKIQCVLQITACNSKTRPEGIQRTKFIRSRERRRKTCSCNVCKHAPPALHRRARLLNGVERGTAESDAIRRDARAAWCHIPLQLLETAIPRREYFAGF